MYRLYISSAFPDISLLKYSPTKKTYKEISKEKFLYLQKEYPTLKTWVDRLQQAFDENHQEVKYPEICYWSVSCLQDYTISLDEDFNAINTQ